MGCCASTSEPGPSAARDIPVMRQGLRESFRLTRQPTAKLKVKWGTDVHSVHSDFRKRRLSDQSLMLLMEDEEIHASFANFMLAIDMSSVERAWRGLNDFETRCASVEAAGARLESRRAEIMEAASALYRDYFAFGAASETLRTFVSSSTLADLENDLAVDKDGRLCQTSLGAIRNAFKVVHVRVHNVLKYEFLPAFLASEQFSSLAEPQEPSSPSQNSAQGASVIEADALDEELDLVFEDPVEGGTFMRPRTDTNEEVADYINDPEKARFFYEFIFKEARQVSGLPSQEDGSQRSSLRHRLKLRKQSYSLMRQLEVVELLLDLEPLQDSSMPDEMRLKRFWLLLHRYGAPDQDLINPPLASLRALHDTYIAAPSASAASAAASAEQDSSSAGELQLLLDPELAEAAPPPEVASLAKLVGPVRHEILKRIEHHIVPAFKRSDTYRLMALEARHSTLADMQPSFRRMQSSLPTVATTIKPSSSTDDTALASNPKSKSAGSEGTADTAGLGAAAAATPPGEDALLAALKEVGVPDSTFQVGGESDSPSSTAAAAAAKRRMSRFRSSPTVGAPLNIPTVDLDPPSARCGSPRSSKEQTASNVEVLRNFQRGSVADPRHFGLAPLSQSGKLVTMEEVLDNSFGILQLKRFARQMFQEENVLFLAEVVSLGRAAMAAHESDLYALLHRAQTICNQYVRAGSPLEINISDEQRRQTIVRYEACYEVFVASMRRRSAVPSLPAGSEAPADDQAAPAAAAAADAPKVEEIFEVAHKEVSQMVNRGLWEDFRGSKLFQEYVRKRRPTATE